MTADAEPDEGQIDAGEAWLLEGIAVSKPRRLSVEEAARMLGEPGTSEDLLQWKANLANRCRSLRGREMLVSLLETPDNQYSEEIHKAIADVLSWDARQERNLRHTSNPRFALMIYQRLAKAWHNGIPTS